MSAALAEGAAGLPQALSLLHQLDPLRNDLQVEGSPQLDYRLGKGGVLGPPANSVDEVLGDLEDVDRESLEVAQRGVSGSEVVYRQLQPQLPQLHEARAHGLGVSAGLRPGMAVHVALDGESALSKAEVSDYDVVVLDRNLPVIDGDEVCRRLQSDGYPARIIMLTAAGLAGERVAGLRLGADDYLSKPFDLAELIARVENLARRPPGGRRVVRGADLEVDLDRRTVTRAGRRIELTASSA